MHTKAAQSFELIQQITDISPSMSGAKWYLTEKSLKVRRGRNDSIFHLMQAANTFSVYRGNIKGEPVNRLTPCDRYFMSIDNQRPLWKHKLLHEKKCSRLSPALCQPWIRMTPAWIFHSQTAGILVHVSAGLLGWGGLTIDVHNGDCTWCMKSRHHTKAYWYAVHVCMWKS